jgi:hypothetical protein
MSGFLRQGQPASLDRAGIRAAVTRFFAAELPAPPCTIDASGSERDCIDPNGHRPVSACGAVVCLHCERVFWR